jgi:hypothetical protein
MRTGNANSFRSDLKITKKYHVMDCHWCKIVKLYCILVVQNHGSCSFPVTIPMIMMDIIFLLVLLYLYKKSYDFLFAGIQALF